MEGIQVSVEKAGPQSDISIIRVGGYIDTTTSSELERALDSLLKAGVFRIIVDLGNVDYISSAGWGIFISEIKGIRERSGDLKLAKMIPDVYEVFELLEFHYILKAFDTIEEAVTNFDGETGIVVDEEQAEKNAPEPAVSEETIEAEEDEAPAGDGIEEKIRELALSNPDWGSARIARELNTESFGYSRINKISVWKIMRKLNLEKKDK